MSGLVALFADNACSITAERKNDEARSFGTNYMGEVDLPLCVGNPILSFDLVTKLDEGGLS